MVSALFQSRPKDVGGTRCLKKGGVSFGWKSIQDLYQREVERMRAGQATRVPKLRESHIIRDSWTRLNVVPSKVMQVSAGGTDLPLVFIVSFIVLPSKMKS